MKKGQAMLLLCGMALLPGCQDSPLHGSVIRLKEACSDVDPSACSKAVHDQDVIAEATGVLAQIKGLCQGLDTGGVTCKKRLEDLAGVMGQVGLLAGSWESISAYSYKAKTIEKVQIATAGTRYWIGAKDNQGAVFVSQNNENLLCGTADLVPAGMELSQFIDGVTNGVAGETREDLLCEKLYPGFPICLGTYTSMCVSTGWHEEDHWSMNMKADEACSRSFTWRAKSEATRAQFLGLLQRYITGLAVQLERCVLKPAPNVPNRMLLECGSGKELDVFRDELRRL